MKTILTGIKAALQGGLSYVRAADVYISPHEQFVPAAVRQPCIGIKDGRVSRAELMAGCLEIAFDVHVCCFVEILKDERSIIGDGASSGIGILEMASDVHGILHGNLLGVSGVTSAFCAGETESRMFDNTRNMLLAKILTYTYTLNSQG